MGFRPSEIEEGVLRVEPFLSNNTLGRQSQDIEASIAYETKVLGGSYGDSRVKEWRVFNSVTIEALSTVFEHG